MRRLQQSKRMVTEAIEVEQKKYEGFSSAQALKRKILTEHSRQKSLEKNELFNFSPHLCKSKFFGNFQKIGSNIYRSYEKKSPQICLWKVNKKINPEETFSISSKKKKLALVDQYMHAPSKLLRESKSTQCPTPKQITNIFSGSLRKYQTIRILGRGKFGEVYLAKHRKTGFIGALKIMKKSMIMENSLQKRERIIQQIISQIKLQWFLNHPNLIKLYDFFDDCQNIYLFVELGSEGHLYDLLEAKGNLSEQSTAIIIRQVLKGIQHLHSKSILHRDLKLQNIVLTHGMAKICDFGWSVYEPSEFRKTICGTPLYLSPQILKRQRYNNKSDIWAVGPLTYELISGQNPFRIRRKEQLDKIITKNPQLRIGSPQIKNFINFILRKDPKKRPDAEILLQHPFLKKYEGLQTSEEICDSNYNKK